MDNTNLTKEQVRKQKIIDLVCSQTDYSREDAEDKLRERNYNYLDVIKEYLNPNRKVIEPSKSLNQQIFQNIRGFMDSSSKDLLRRQEYYKKAREMSFEKNSNSIIQKENTSIDSAEVTIEENKKNIINI